MKKSSIVMMIALFGFVPNPHLNAQTVNSSQSSKLDESQVVSFTDSDLQSFLNVKYFGADGKADITVNQMQSLTKLFIPSAGISSLDGLEYATNLESLTVTDNEIKDIEPVASLKQLRQLTITYTDLEDISPLAGLKGLEELNLSHNQISDIRALSSLTYLTEVNLNDNHITDASSLRGLPMSTLYNTHITSQSITLPEITVDTNNEITYPVTAIDGTKINVSLGNPRKGSNQLTGKWSTNNFSGDISQNVIFDGPSEGDNSSEVHFSDAKLQAFLNTNYFGAGPKDSITEAQMESLTDVNLDNAGISSLGGIEAATNLKSISAKDNELTNISPLAKLSQLEKVDFTNNKITDPSVLSYLPHLGQIILDGNNIHDVSSLSKTPAYRNYRISVENQTLNLEPITQTQAKEVTSFVTGFKGNTIEVDLGMPTAGTHTLTGNWSDGGFSGTVSEQVTVEETTTPPVQPEGDIVQFEDMNLKMYLNKNYFKQSYDADITTDQMASLTKLSIVTPNITSLVGLETATNLRILTISSNTITDLTPISGLTNLRELDIEACSITDLTPLSKLTNLEYLNLSKNQISDLSPLENLTSLKSIDLNYNKISDVSPLAGLGNLRVLNLDQNKISDLRPLQKLGLDQLQVRNQYVELEPITVNDNSEISYPVYGVDGSRTIVKLGVPQKGTSNMFGNWDAPGFTGKISQQVTYIG